ncbi:tRNA (adenosine(37)-N6)-threonylcarbamoyltransferase complex dimerization subunit type 1 TsaB [Mangrovibacter yixingensis]|uniref:tRNA (adenosine(37)-N6)-threonylcarbamoyltransferase complex dimerization subunit type 1 TsaB n=1 Tax=Mangrovibacter yixingensis TaxID=1529639 RepID=UPI001CFB08A3|nr:tRNA (adenosine(37)-N6)-threonylcarbamoyltransferase complex dimerization subunit type 1 TsaB [Mangrovibacter yixingensis]
MRILAIDTATEACSVAVWNDGKTYAHFELCPREHTQRILPLVQDLLNQSGVSLSDVDALAFGRGPGSFTGVRIGIGIAQGLALGAQLPLAGVSTLATMAQGAFRLSGATRVLCAIDARMGEVYWAEYQRDAQGQWHGEETECVCKPEAVTARLQQLEGEWVTVGTGWEAWPEMAKDTGLSVTSAGVTLPMAEDMLPFAIQAVEQHKTLAVEQSEPVYLRNEVAWKKLPGRE